MRTEPLFELVVRDSRAYVLRREDQRLLGGLTKLEAAALKMLAEGFPLEQVKHTFQLVVPNTTDQVLQRVDARFSALLAHGRGIAAPSPFQDFMTVQAPDPREGLRELPGPRVLHWHVTRYCPRKCAYCYAEPIQGGQAGDATLNRSELQKIFKEAATLGAEHLVVAGAEPLLRADLPEVMGDAIANRLTPFLTTKHPISKQLALRLAKAGVAHISLSLDTVSPQQSLVMIGSKSYPAQIRSSATNLSQAGVRFSVQSVVTGVNANAISGVAEFASDLGATVMQVVPFESVRRPIAKLQNQDLFLEGKDLLRKTVEDLASRYPNVRFELFEKLGTGSRAQFHCDIGMTKLFFLPDGSVHRCYKLVDDSTLIGKDLKTCSVAEAWHDPQFGSVISPSRSLYRSSTCGACGRFGNCHSEGRCIYEASVNHGTYYGQDRSCDGPFPIHPNQQFIPLDAIQA